MYKIDFYIEFDIFKFAIEYNGKQHYEPIEFFGGRSQFEKQIRRDKELREYCKNNDIELFEIKYDSDIESEIQLILRKILPLLQETTESATDEIGEVCDDNPEITK